MTTLQTCMHNSINDMMIRCMNAENSFIEYLTEQGFSKSDAETILNSYKKAKAIKIDKHNGSWTVIHGVFLEPDVLQNTLALSNRIN